MDDDEMQPIFRTSTGETRDLCRQIRNYVQACVLCGPNFKWLFLACILLAQLVGLVMFTIWAVDCFLREFHTTPTCKHFVLFPAPGKFEIAWLSMCITTSLFLIFHVCRRSSTFPGSLIVLRHMIKKKFFFKITFVLIVVCIYDLVVILDQPTTVKTISYVFFMIDKFLMVTLVFLLNFLPRFWNDDDVKLKWWLYKISLVVCFLGSYLLAILGSTIALYKLVTVSVPQTDDGRPDAKTVVALMLLITNNGLRFFVGDFFLSKLFDESQDILGGAKNINEIFGLQDEHKKVEGHMEENTA